MVEDPRLHDVIVIGAGIVGLAAAYQLQRRSPGSRVAVVDKEQAIGSHQTGHNSGVVHAGIYYEPGSQKALLCRRGKEALERFAEEHEIPFRRCGKLIVAIDPSELSRLEELRRRGTANRVPGLQMLGPEQLTEYEPNVTALRALRSPTTGIINFRRVAEALAGEIRGRGGSILLGTTVRAIRRTTRGWQLDTTSGAREARALIACAGLHSDRVAALTGHAEGEKIVPFRGRYLRLRPARSHLVRSLVYTVPDPQLPFLGVHLTRTVDDEVLLGPNVGLALSREGYWWGAVNVRDVAEMVAYPGLWRLLGRYPRAVARELWRDVSRRAFVAEARRFVPSLRARDFLPGPSGVRAQLVNADGTLAHDFSFEGEAGLLHVRNAPSPGATSSLAIGEVIAERVLAQL